MTEFGHDNPPAGRRAELEEALADAERRAAEAQGVATKMVEAKYVAVGDQVVLGGTAYRVVEIRSAGDGRLVFLVGTPDAQRWYRIAARAYEPVEIVWGMKK